MSSRTFVYRPTGCSRKPHDIAAYAAKLRCRKFCAVFFFLEHLVLGVCTCVVVLQAVKVR